MAINGVRHNYDYFGTTTNYIRGKATVSPQNEVKTQDKAQMFDTKYQKTAVSIMEQAKEKFLVAFKSINYKQGTATSILSDIMKKC